MLKFARPIVVRIATVTDWPVILIDLHTEEGVVGRSYLQTIIPKAMTSLVPALHDLGAMLKGRRIAPIEFYDLARKSLQFVGYEGLSMMAVSGLDMAAWDAPLPRQPECRFASCSVGRWGLWTLTTATLCGLRSRRQSRRRPISQDLLRSIHVSHGSNIERQKSAEQIGNIFGDGLFRGDGILFGNSLGDH